MCSHFVLDEPSVAKGRRWNYLGGTHPSMRYHIEKPNKEERRNTIQKYVDRNTANTTHLELASTLFSPAKCARQQFYAAASRTPVYGRVQNPSINLWKSFEKLLHNMEEKNSSINLWKSFGLFVHKNKK